MSPTFRSTYALFSRFRNLNFSLATLRQPYLSIFSPFLSLPATIIFCFISPLGFSFFTSVYFSTDRLCKLMEKNFLLLFILLSVKLFYLIFLDNYYYNSYFCFIPRRIAYNKRIRTSLYGISPSFCISSRRDRIPCKRFHRCRLSPSRKTHIPSVSLSPPS